MKKILLAAAVFLLISAMSLLLILTVTSVLAALTGEEADGGVDCSEVSVVQPITITGTIKTSGSRKIVMDFSGGITASGVKGSLKKNNTFTAKSDKDAKVSMALPSSPPARLDFCSYMPQFDQSLYDIHLDTTSPQYKLNKLCKTDKAGFRRLDEAYLVAMGTYYGGRDNIGDMYYITFKRHNGKKITIKAVLGDVKSDDETDSLHQYHASDDKSVVEFIMGSRDNQHNSTIQKKFGTITSIKKVGMIITAKGEIDGTAITISGKANGKAFSASGTVKDGKFTATGFYGTGSGALLWPTTSTYITSEFGYRTAGETGGVGTTDHAGIDIGVSSGSNVYAAAAGTVTLAGWFGGYGKCVIISHDNGMTTIYGHLSSVKVKTGQKVNQGKIIALSGNTGNSTGPHLHFEVKINGTPVDPMKYTMKK